MNVILTLNSPLGSDMGPNFSLTPNTGSITPTTASKTQLLAGITCAVDPAIASITVQSIGLCTNSLVVPVTGVKVATMWAVANIESPVGYDTSPTACSEGGVTGVTITVYYTGTLGNGTKLYSDPNMGNEINSGGSTNGWFWIGGHSFNYQYVVGVSQVTNYTTC